MVEKADIGLQDRKMNIHEMVNEIAAALFNDSHVTIDKFKMTDALDRDLGLNGLRRLNQEEIDLLVMGEDEGGIPDHLVKLYPNVNAEIASYF